jgi:hypothetical protein
MYIQRHNLTYTHTVTKYIEILNSNNTFLVQKTLENTYAYWMQHTQIHVCKSQIVFIIRHVVALENCTLLNIMMITLIITTLFKFEVCFIWYLK